MGDKKACEKKEMVKEEDAKYKCKKCDRLAKKEKHLCKPKKLDN